MWLHDDIWRHRTWPILCEVLIMLQLRNVRDWCRRNPIVEAKTAVRESYLRIKRSCTGKTTSSQGPLFTNRAWWRHQMTTFSTLLAICAGNLPVNGEFPAQRPVTRSFDVVFDLRLNKRLSNQWWGWWFETLSRPLWRHCSGLTKSAFWVYGMDK